MRMHISHMAFQSNELENDTLPKWHIHTFDNRVERPEKKPQNQPTANQPHPKPTPKLTLVV